MTADSSTGGPIAPESTSPPEDTAFDAILQALVVGASGLPSALVRPRWQATPPPEPDQTVTWCAVGVVDEDAGFAYFERHDGAADSGTGATTTQTQSTVRVLATFYGSAARGTANLFRDALMVPQNRESLFPFGSALIEPPSVARYVPEVINQQARQRVDIEFLLRVSSVRVWPIRNIVSVPVAITADDDYAVSITAQDSAP